MPAALDKLPQGKVFPQLIQAASQSGFILQTGKTKSTLAPPSWEAPDGKVVGVYLPGRRFSLKCVLLVLVFKVTDAK